MMPPAHRPSSSSISRDVDDEHRVDAVRRVVETVPIARLRLCADERIRDDGDAASTAPGRRRAGSWPEQTLAASS
jgi:hypothetical protein